MALACFTLSASAYDMVQLFDGEECVAQLKIADTPTITSSAGEIVVTAGAMSLSFPNAITAKFASSSAVEAIQSINNNPSISVNGDIIEVAALPAGARMEVYSLDGISLAASTADASGNACVILSQKGCFIVVLPGLSFKIAK